MSTEQPITTILLCGFLGAGKTTLLSNLLQTKIPKTEKVAVLVNEFGKLPIDGALLPDGDFPLYEINKGSIFCVCVKTDLLRDLDAIARNINPDLLLIEATGMAEPTDFTALLQTEYLQQRYRKGRTICVVDAENFAKLVNMLPALQAQVKLGDLLVINKTDLVDESVIADIKQQLRRLNPTAEITETTYGQLSPEHLKIGQTQATPDTGEDFHLCESAPSYLVNCEIRTDVVTDKRAFYELLDKHRTQILRAKGIVTFGDGARFVEVVNGTVSSKSALPSKLKTDHPTAMSFVLTDLSSIEMQSAFGKLTG